MEYQWLHTMPGGTYLFDEFFQINNRYGKRDLLFPNYPHGHLCISVNYQLDHMGVYLFGLNRTTWKAALTRGEFVFGGAVGVGDVYRLLGVPAVEFTDRIIPFHDIWPSESHQLLEKIAEASTMFERANTLNSFFEQFSYGRNSSHPLVSSATDSLYTSPEISIRQLAKNHGVSRRQLSRLFSQHVGLTPKTLGRIFRLKRAKNILQFKSDICLSDLSCQLGFYDQPHFNNEFKRFYGAPPVEYIQNGLDLQ